MILNTFTNRIMQLSIFTFSPGDKWVGSNVPLGITIDVNTEIRYDAPFRANNVIYGTIQAYHKHPKGDSTYTYDSSDPNYNPSLSTFLETPYIASQTTISNPSETEEAKFYCFSYIGNKSVTEAKAISLSNNQTHQLSVGNYAVASGSIQILDKMYEVGSIIIIKNPTDKFITALSDNTHVGFLGEHL